NVRGVRSPPRRTIPNMVRPDPRGIVPGPRTTCPVSHPLSFGHKSLDILEAVRTPRACPGATRPQCGATSAESTWHAAAAKAVGMGRRRRPELSAPGRFLARFASSDEKFLI